ncbi:MAG: hypothetical protein GYB37_12995 [Algicola sp.]|nr:hypothetical protein [Algicola sp.]
MKYFIKTIMLLSLSIFHGYGQEMFTTKLVTELNTQEKCLYENFVKIIKANIVFPEKTKFFHKVRFSYVGQKVMIRSHAHGKSKLNGDYYSDIILDYGIDIELSNTPFSCEEKTWKVAKTYFGGNMTRTVDSNFILENETDFEEVNYVLEEYAAVKENGLWGLVDKNGKYIVAPKYEYMKRHYLGVMVKEDGMFFFLNGIGGKITYSNKYAKISNSMEIGRDTFDIVAMRDGNYGLLNYKQEEITPFIYTRIYSIGKGIVIGDKKGKVTLLDGKSGYEASKMYDKIENRSLSSSILVTTNEGLLGLIAKSGEEIQSPKYRTIRTDVSDDYCVLESTGLSSIFIYETGRKSQVKNSYDEISYLNGVLSKVTKDGLVGAINKKGKLIIPYYYDALSTDLQKKGEPIYAFKNDKKIVLDNNGKCVGNCP